MTSNRSNVLRKLADLLEAHPEIEMPYLDSNYADFDINTIRFQFTAHGEAAADAAAAVTKAFPGPFQKVFNDDDFYLYGKFEGVTVDIRIDRADCKPILSAVN